MFYNDSDHLTLGATIAAICVPLGVYVYRKTKHPAPFEEQGQKIVPLEVTVDNIREGFEDRPYMPFRYPNNQTMSLVKLDVNFWSIVDRHYFDFMSQKKRIFNHYDPEKLKEHPFYKTLDTAEATAALVELRDFVVDHLTHRFPKLFTRRGNLVCNHLLDETYDLDVVAPLVVVTRMSMEDYYVTVLDPHTQERTCVGVSVAFGGGGFPIAPIVGQGMDAIHGPVPYYESKLKKSMNKWFERFTDPVERASIHIVWDNDLSCSELYSKQRELGHAAYAEYIQAVPFEAFSVRVERQTLIKLPKSNAIIFANHPIYLNIAHALADEPGVPAIVHKMMYDSPEGIIKYKHYELIRDHISPGLLAMVDAQVQRGLVAKDDPVRTIPGFPFASWMNDPAAFSTSRGFVKPSSSVAL